MLSHCKLKFLFVVKNTFLYLRSEVNCLQFCCPREPLVSPIKGFLRAQQELTSQIPTAGWPVLGEAQNRAWFSWKTMIFLRSS